MSAAEGFELWQEQAVGKSACDFTFHMGVTRFDEQTAKELREIVKARHRSFKIFLAYKGAFGIDDTELYRTLEAGEGTRRHRHRALRERNARRRDAEGIARRGQDRSRTASREPAAARRGRGRASPDDLRRTDRRACLHRALELRGSAAAKRSPRGNAA